MIYALLLSRFTHFFRKIFWTGEQTPQIFSLFGCMQHCPIHQNHQINWNHLFNQNHHGARYTWGLNKVLACTFRVAFRRIASFESFTRFTRITSFTRTTSFTRDLREFCPSEYPASLYATQNVSVSFLTRFTRFIRIARISRITRFNRFA